MKKKNIENKVSSFEDTFRKFTLSSIFGTLEVDNNVDKIHMPGYSKKEIIEICNSFEEKHNKKLNYKFANNAYYLSY